MAKKVTVGVVGLGMGRHHLREFAACPRAEILALCDIDQSRLRTAQEEFGAKHVFTDYRKMLQLPGLQAVSVVTPNRLHMPQTIAALQAGLHVMCEKPLAMNYAQAQRMVAEAKRRRRILMMHYNGRFCPESFFLKRYVEEGRLGRIYFAKAAYIRRRGIPRLGSWFTQKAQSGGGALIDIGVHALDLALWLMGYPKPVEVVGGVYAKFGPALASKTQPFDVDDLSCGLIRFADGATLFLEASWHSNIARDAFSVHLLGTKAGAERNGGVHIYGEEAGATVDWTPQRYTERVPSAQEHFVDCILSGRKPIAPGEEGMQTVRILEAIYKSAARGRAVHLA